MRSIPIFIHVPRRVLDNSPSSSDVVEETRRTLDALRKRLASIRRERPRRVYASEVSGRAGRNEQGLALPNREWSKRRGRSPPIHGKINRSLAMALPPAADLDAELDRAKLIADLRAWREGEPPEALPDPIARALAHWLQRMPGGLASPLRKTGARAAREAGSVVRESGELHEVMVVPDGFLWQGQIYASLSTARAGAVAASSACETAPDE